QFLRRLYCRVRLSAAGAVLLADRSKELEKGLGSAVSGVWQERHRCFRPFRIPGEALAYLEGKLRRQKYFALDLYLPTHFCAAGGSASRVAAVCSHFCGNLLARDADLLSQENLPENLSLGHVFSVLNDWAMTDSPCPSATTRICVSL